MRPLQQPGPFAVRYALRGPELAIVLPDQDDEALLEICRGLSNIWNGPGALLVPVDLAGEPRAGLDASFAALPPDRFLVHPSVSTPATAALESRWPDRVAEWSSDAIEHEIHPWWLVRDAAVAGAPLPLPVLAQGSDARLRAALWGHLEDGDLEVVRKQFEVQTLPSERFFVGQVEAQLKRQSPLAWAARFTDHVECVNGPTQRGLFVFDDASFDSVVLFWNLRARYPTFAGECSFVGVPVEAFSSVEPLGEAIRAWLAEPPRATKPDVLVSVTEESAATAKAGLEAMGLAFVEGARWTVFSSVPAERQAPEFAIGLPTIPHRLRRGTSGEALIGLRVGTNPVHLPVPSAFPAGVSWHGLVSAEVGGLPLSFPMSNPLAQACWTGSEQCGDHLVVRLSSLRDTISAEPRRPPGEVELAKHLASVSLAGRTSGAGRLAQTLLGRLSTREDLDALAVPHSLDVLEALVMPSRKKLAQRVRQELQTSGVANVDERVVVDLLRKEGLFAELSAKSAAQLQGSAGLLPDAILACLGPLCAAGLLQRGRAVECPQCQSKDYRRLAELDEQIECRACLKEFPLPAVEGKREASTVYRLDGLVARAMDQDIVPVLLTLRYLLRRAEATDYAQWWPGLDLFEDGSEDPDYEVDLLIADRGKLLVCEVKKQAASLTRDEAIKHFELARRIGGEPVLSAPSGEWAPEVMGLFDSYDFLLLDGSVLIEPTAQLTD